MSSESEFLIQSALPTLSAASLQVLTGLVFLFDCFFNSLGVGAPCSLIFWHFWLFIDFRLVVTLFWLCEEAKGFSPCFPIIIFKGVLLL